MEDALDPTIPGTRKAAILMVLLGHDVAGRLLKELPPKTATEIITEVAHLDLIDSATADAVLDDYFVEAVRPERHRGGPDFAQHLMSSVEVPTNQQREILGDTSDPAQDLLGPLLDTPADTLSAVLAQEHCQTAALVLLHLDARKAAQVLSGMEDEIRTEVVNRMTGLRRVPGEILQEVVEGLGDRVRDPSARAADDDKDGLERTAVVLQAMARCEVRELLDGVERHSPDDAARLRELVFTFDSLLLADDRGIQELLRAVEMKTLATALDGEEQTLLDKFLDNLSERAAGMLKEEIEFLGTVRPADRQSAQREITDKALELEQEERLTFEDPASEEPTA